MRDLEQTRSRHFGSDMHAAGQMSHRDAEITADQATLLCHIVCGTDVRLPVPFLKSLLIPGLSCLSPPAIWVGPFQNQDIRCSCQAIFKMNLTSFIQEKSSSRFFAGCPKAANTMWVGLGTALQRGPAKQLKLSRPRRLNIRTRPMVRLWPLIQLPQARHSRRVWCVGCLCGVLPHTGSKHHNDHRTKAQRPSPRKQTLYRRSAPSSFKQRLESFQQGYKLRIREIPLPEHWPHDSRLGLALGFGISRMT